MDDDRIDMLHHSLFIPMNVANAVPIIIMAIGGAVALVGIIMMMDILLKMVSFCPFLHNTLDLVLETSTSV